MSYQEQKLREQAAMKNNKRYCNPWHPNLSVYISPASGYEQAIYGKRLNQTTTLINHNWGKQVNRMIKKAYEGK